MARIVGGMLGLGLIVVLAALSAAGPPRPTAVEHPVDGAASEHTLTYRIVNRASLRPLVVRERGRDAVPVLVQGDHHHEATDQWQLHRVGRRSAIVNVGAGLAVQSVGGSVTLQRRGGPAAPEVFTITDVGAAIYRISPLGQHTTLAVAKNSQQRDAPMVLAGPIEAAEPDAEWFLEPVQLALSPMLVDHMVLQRDAAVAVFGSAPDGA